MNTNQKEGTLENLKGRIMQALGIVTGDKNKETEGASERASGAVKKAVGDLRHAFAKKVDK